MGGESGEGVILTTKACINILFHFFMEYSSCLLKERNLLEKQSQMGEKS